MCQLCYDNCLVHFGSSTYHQAQYSLPAVFPITRTGCWRPLQLCSRISTSVSQYPFGPRGEIMREQGQVWVGKAVHQRAVVCLLVVQTQRGAVHVLRHPQETKEVKGEWT